MLATAHVRGQPQSPETRWSCLMASPSILQPGHSRRKARWHTAHCKEHRHQFFPWAISGKTKPSHTSAGLSLKTFPKGNMENPVAGAAATKFCPWDSSKADLQLCATGDGSSPPVQAEHLATQPCIYCFKKTPKHTKTHTKHPASLQKDDNLSIFSR